MPDIFFTADTHFGHKRSLTLDAGSSISSAEEIDELLIERWNERVGLSDNIYHLGDFSFRSRERTERIIDRLNGRIHLVRGNHDQTLDSIQYRFASFQQYQEIRVGTQLLALFHFPILSWHHADRGAWHLHGHCHGELAEDPAIPRMDVGVDCTDFAPIAYEEVAERLAGRVWTPADRQRSGVAHLAALKVS